MHNIASSICITFPVKYALQGFFRKYKEESLMKRPTVSDMLGAAKSVGGFS
jgi:hypothetical protein